MKETKENKLVRAIKAYDATEAIRLLDGGANPNFVDSIGESILHIAMERGDPLIIKAVLNRLEINVNVYDYFKTAPIHIAARDDLPDIISLMKLKGADIDLLDGSHVTALHVACIHKNLAAARVLIGLGANVNIRVGEDVHLGYNSYTPLHLAASKGDLELVGLLLINKADIKAKTEQGLTARDIFKLKYPTKLMEFDATVTQAKAKLMEDNTEPVCAAPQKIEIEKNTSTLLSNSHPTMVSSLMPKSTKRKQADDNGKILKNGIIPKKYKAAKDEVEEDQFDNIINSGEDDTDSGFSSSNSPNSPFGSGIARSYSSKSADPQSSSYFLNKEQSASYKQQQQALQVNDRQSDSSAEENLLLTLFVWIKDLPEILQQQILSLFSMQQVLTLLEKATHPDKFIIDQLSNQSVEEKFNTEYQKYFAQDSFVSDSGEHAHVTQDNSLEFLDKDVEVISSDGVLIDPLPKHDINFCPPHLFGSITS